MVSNNQDGDRASLTEYGRSFRELHQRVRETGRPLFVTGDGATDAVVLSPESYDELLEKADLIENLASIERGLRDAEAGRVQPFRDAVRELARKHGMSF